MVEDSPEYQRCRFCNSTFSDEILDKIQKMSDRTLANYCNELNLERPENGYWHQKKFFGKFS